MIVSKPVTCVRFGTTFYPCRDLPSHLKLHSLCRTVDSAENAPSTKTVCILCIPWVGSGVFDNSLLLTLCPAASSCVFVSNRFKNSSFRDHAIPQVSPEGDQELSGHGDDAYPPHPLAAGGIALLIPSAELAGGLVL